MHGFSYVIISTERERQITDTATHFRSWKIVFDPVNRPDKIKGIAVMLFHSGGYRQNIRIKDYIVRIKSDT